jgi:hypothetical protein
VGKFSPYHYITWFREMGREGGKGRGTGGFGDLGEGRCERKGGLRKIRKM